MKTRHALLRLMFLLVSGWVLAACSFGSSGSSGSSASISCSSPSTGLTAPTGINVMPLTVSNCSTSYENEPLVSVKICQHGSTTNCQTISNILVDTGSYGLRVFSSVISSSVLNGLSSVSAGAGSLAECAVFGLGASLWGPVAKGDVVLGDLSGTETASNVAIQLINASYGSVPGNCDGSYTTPASAGYSGILGVGLWSNDCPSCVTLTSPNQYFSCSGSTCTSTTVVATNQVTNPVVELPTDNQGVQLVFPSVSASAGSPPLKGYMLLGIDSRTTTGGYYNNSSSGYTLYAASSQAPDFQATYNGSHYTSFIDSGSNALFFPNNSGIAECAIDSYEYLCPSSLTVITPTLTGCTGAELSPACTGSATTPSLSIYNALTLLESGNAVFSSLAVPSSGSQFDVGFPFFLGKTVLVGITGQSSSLGTGPYWGF